VALSAVPRAIDTAPSVCFNPVALVRSSAMGGKPLFARASATPTAEAGAAYVSLMAHGEADRLLGVSSPAAKMAALHKTVEADGVMKMEHVEALDIPADGMLEMKPGGYHIMLMGLTQPLKEGDEIEITLTFEKAGEVKLKAKVGGVAAGTN